MLAAGGLHASRPHLDWAQGITVGALLLSWAVTVGIRGLRAKSSIPSKFRDERLQTKSAITTGTIVPRIAGVIVAVAQEIDWGDPAAPPPVQQLVEQAADVLTWSHQEAVSTLGGPYVDKGDCDRLEDSIVAWTQIQAGAAAAYCVPALYFAVAIALRNYRLPTAASYAAGLVMAVAVTVFLVAILREVRARNQRATLVKRYES